MNSEQPSKQPKVRITLMLDADALPYVEKEVQMVDSNSVTIRRLDSNKQENMDLDLFLKSFSALNKASSN